MIGETILHYKIIEKLGEGGMGVVYKAEDTKLKREVAIKFLPRYISSNGEQRKRFEIEAQAAASLNHPNVSTIYAIEESGDNVFIVMEFIDGIDLKEKISSGPIPYDETIDIALQIVEGLEAAHKKGIVHRDIKTSNVMLTKDGKIKVMDFGLAKIKGGSDVTQLGTTIGTVAYMSPEQTNSEEIDSRSDIWSFGVVLYEMLTGKQPFRGSYDQAIIYSILNEEPDFSNIPEDLAHLLKKALSKQLPERYNNSSEVLDDLKSMRNDLISKSLTKKSMFIKPAKKTRLKLITTLTAVLIVTTLVTIFLLTNKNESNTNTGAGRTMIVVMPFDNLGSQNDNYFADGVTEEITSKLASIVNIGVISTNSAEKIAKANKSTQEIGKELGVNYILEGKILWAKENGNVSRVRITPQLTRVSDNTITWSESYDRVLNDIFAVQNEIAQKVVDQLNGSLNTNQIQKTIRPTDNLEAYDLYLRGLAYTNRGTYLKDDLQASIDLFSKAVVLDPKFALAYANLSRSKSEMYWFFYDRSEKNAKESYNDAQKAYRLNPDLAETHLALGYYYYWCELNYNRAITEFTQVLKIQPNNVEAVFGLGIVYRRMGNFDLALKNQLKGALLDPLSVEYAHNVAETYGLIRDYSNAGKYYKRVNELNPNLDFPIAGLAQNYVDWKGDIKVAEGIMKEAKGNDYLQTSFNISVYLDILGRNYDKAIKDLNSVKNEFEAGQFRFTPRTQILGLVYRLKNQSALSKQYLDSSRVQLEKMIRNISQDERLHSSLGITYAGLGNKEKALAEGKKGIELLPLEKEAYRGYFRQWDLAIIYTLIGDNNNALKQIEFILSIPGAFSVNQLKMDPTYDSLRNLPGYKAIIDKYSSN